ncbi:WD40 repeat domain-containing protein, partial [filamentous cyanobacterium LEGE 11480]
VWSVAFSPDGKRIVSGSRDATLRLWDAQTGQPIGQPLKGHSNPVLSVAFSPDGKRIVSGSWDKTLRLWDAQTGQPIGQPLKGHSNSVWSVAFSPDGKRIVSGSSDKTLRIWPGDWSGLMRLACDRLQYHPLLNAPETVVSGELIQVGRDAKAACDARPWLEARQPTPQPSWWEKTVDWVAGLWR